MAEPKPYATGCHDLDEEIFSLRARAEKAEAALATLQKRVEKLEAALMPAFKAIDRIKGRENDMQRRRDVEIGCFYAVQIARAALQEEAKG